MSVLILGATSPIARQLAARYAEAGQAVYCAARDVDEAAAIAADLRVRYPVTTAAGAFDAVDLDAHPALIAAAEAAVGPLDTVIVAFGDMGSADPATDTDFTAARRVIDINFTGAASVCEAAAAAMTPRGTGHIIAISSVAGDRGRQSNYLYGSAKGALTLYLQGLRNRLFPLGVKVMTVKLGFVDTRMTFGMQTGIPIASPEAVSRAIIKAQGQGTDVMYYPKFWAGIMGIIKAIPEGAFKRLKL